MLSSEQYSTLLATVQDTSRPLISKVLWGCQLLILLEDDTILCAASRLASLFVLFNLFPQNHPFTASVADAVRLKTTSDVERSFVQHLFSKSSSKTSSKPPSQLLNELPPAEDSTGLPFLQPSPDLSVPALLRLPPVPMALPDTSPMKSVPPSMGDFVSKLNPVYIRPPPPIPVVNKELPPCSMASPPPASSNASLVRYRVIRVQY
ncbi:hypothetical protein GEMRC1_010318 [Eukaryota sp. GEM-RC1]